MPNTEQMPIWLQVLFTVFIILSPILAVAITLLYQHLQDRRKTKMQTFVNLVAYRGSLVGSQNFSHLVNSLNTIDVVFHDCPNIVKLWHEYYAILQQEQTEPNAQNGKHKLLDLLDAMGKKLGYPNIKQTDFDKFYNPVVFWNQSQKWNELQSEILRVLKSSESFSETKKTSSEEIA